MKKPQQSNVLLDDQAKKDARMIAKHYNLRGVSAAIRYALRDMARRLEQTNVATSVADPKTDPPETAP